MSTPRPATPIPPISITVTCKKLKNIPIHSEINATSEITDLHLGKLKTDIK